MTTPIPYRPHRPARLEPGTATLGLGIATVAAAAAVKLGAAAFVLPIGLALAVVFVWQPLALLTLFVYVGLYKDEAVLQALPVDGTLLLGALLAAVCVHRLACSKLQRVPFGLAAPLAVVGVMLVVSLGWTPAPAFGAEKAARFVSLTLLATVAPFFLVREGRDLRRFFGWTIAFAFFTAAYALANPPAPSTELGRLTFGGDKDSNTIAISQLLCTAALILLLVGLAARAAARWWSVCSAVALIAVAAAVGSRGPLLSLVLALAATAAVWSLRVPRKVVPILVVIAVGVAIVPAIPLPETASQRLEQAVSDPGSSLENDPRWVLYHQAADIIREHPLRGIGAGGFKSVGLATVPEAYPHNLVLELWTELGLAAVIVVVTSIGAVLVGLLRLGWRHPRMHERELLYMVLGVFLLYLFSAQLSGDINGNRAFWAAFGLAWMVVRNPGSLAMADELDAPRRASASSAGGIR